jgi:rfaE bifunctional protein nucleotidyltransferase chain/domain
MPKWLQKKLVEPAKLEEKIAEIKAEGRSIATLNGSFDLMHAGHLYIIDEAAKQADCLIVALNSDSSIKQYKGALRPIIPLAYRLQMMAALEFVDYVTWFDETDPRELLSKIKPDVHVNGAEYGANCIEADVVKMHGGKIYIVPRIDGLATSHIIEKIKQCV